MSYTLFADSSCNLPNRKLEDCDVHIICGVMEMEGRQFMSPKSPDGFDGHSYYDKLRHGATVKTSLINSAAFEEAFRPELEQGHDVVFVGMSSGISGTIQSAMMAEKALKFDFPERSVMIIDSKGCGLGTGILVCKAADYRDEGLSAMEAAVELNHDVVNLCEYFSVDDLGFLKRTGRVKGITAAVGSMLQIKPILRGDEHGDIVVCQNVRGRKKVIPALMAQFEKKARDIENQRVAISHGDCLEEARALANCVLAIAKPKELILSLHEPLSGSHVGPGMLALFFFGEGR